MNMRDGEPENAPTAPEPSDEEAAGSETAPTPPVPDEEETQDQPRPQCGANQAADDESAAADVFARFEPPRSPDERGRFAGYRILGLLGSGGMGLVFEAEDPLLRRRVALKILRPEKSNPVMRVRFLREAQTAASLNDDHVVTIYQVGERDGWPYLVMELLRGESLEQRLKQERWLPLSEALNLARQIAQGLRSAHAVGLVHRDIKPANIWLEQPLGGPGPGQGPVRIKILDFGLAKPLRDETGLTQEGVMVGTPAYISPEQLEGRPANTRSDLYALGVVLYRMIAGVSPFEAPSIPRLMAAILDQNPPPVSSIRGRMLHPVEKLLEELLSKNPDDRPRDAETVIERLRAIEDQLPLVAAEGSGPAIAATTGPVHRRIGPGVWLGVGAIAASVVIGLAVLWQNLRKANVAVERAPTAAAPHDVAAAGLAGEDPGDPRTRSLPTPTPAGLPIKVGLLHSLTGPLSSIERPMVEAESLAIEEINQDGGLLGRTIEKVIADGRSDEFVFADQARQLIEKSRVDVLIGCLSSASRKRVKDVCEEHGVLLFYPMIFEGLERSSSIVYVGGGPNQQLLPMVRWAIGFFDPPRRRFFLLGSESIFSRASQETLRGELEKHGLEPVGVRSLPLGQVTGFDAIVDAIRRSQADIVLDTLDVESDMMFFKILGQRGITAADLPVISICLGEDQLRTLDHKLIADHYSALNYFETIETPENMRFLKRLHDKHAVPSVNASMESSYLSVLFWKRAVEKAGSLEAAKVRAAVAGQEIQAPEGRVRIDPTNFYGSRLARIGRMSENGTFDIVYSSSKPMPTLVYPPPYDQAGWETFLAKLLESWGGRWSAGTATH